MSKELTSSQKKEWAKMLYLQDQLNQKQIAAKVGVNEATMSRWVKAEQWESLRKSLLTSKNEILQNLYGLLDKLGKRMKEDDSVGDSKIADMYVKYSAAIKNLETETSIAQIMESGMQFHKFLQGFDPELAMTMLNHYDAFVKQKLKSN